MVTGEPEVARFRGLLARTMGWTFADTDTGQLDRLLGDRAGVHGMSRGDYLNRLGARPWPDELTELVERLSITETYFFRHPEQFRALREEALPRRVAARSTQRALRMLSVACSSGEEAYTMAIVARQVQAAPNWIVSVLGVDANPAMLRRAQAGWYSAWALRETPDRVRRRWFRPADGGYRVVEEAHGLVRLQEYNVAEPDDALWRAGQYDVIFCRNLLMYLTAAVADALVERMTWALAPGGYLFLGHTDSLGHRPAALDLCHTHEAFYYCRPGGPPPAQRPAPAEPIPDRRPDTTAGEDVYDRAVTLLRDERFADALALIGTAMPDRPLPRDVLLHGVLLAQAGRFDEAGAVARRLIDDSGLYADAHQLLGLCREGAGAVDDAISQYRLAAYLDPAFALPRLRLGQLARRRGDDRGAAAELERALYLLAREDGERITLFGGGFGRITLTMLCRSELEACEALR